MARILAMETTSLADAKNRLSELVATVEGTWERILITKNGKPAAVLIAPDDLESLLETLDVLSDPETMAAIKEARGPDRPAVHAGGDAGVDGQRFGRSSGAA